MPFPLAEEHAVKFAAVRRLDPVMLCIELRLQYQSKLLDLAEEHSVAAAASCALFLAPAEAA